MATARNPGLAIGMHVSRGAVFHSTAIVVSGTFLLLVAGAGYLVRFMGGEWGRALQILFFFFALLAGVLVLSSGRFRAKLRVFVGKHFFPYRYDYREEWLRFTRTLGDASAARDVQERIIRALSDLVESPAGVLWLRNDDGTFRVAARLNMNAANETESFHASLPRFLERTGWVIDVEECKTMLYRYEGLDLPSWLSNMPSAWLVAPLLAGVDLIGFVLLAKPRVAIDVNWEVRDIVKVAGRQAATYLGQFQATEALVEARKFEAFNRMSAFVVHDLKNLVAQLSLMLKNAERHRGNPEFQRDMLSTVEHVVERMQQLLLQLQTGATPLGKPRSVNLQTIVRNVFASRSADLSRIGLDLECTVNVLGHEDRLDHVIGHLLQNALDATSAGGKVGIQIYRQEQFGVVEVFDSGVGMDADFMRKRLFKPFETSKPAGMGIGVYESAQYVASLGGRILFDSTPAVGTRVRVLLPAAEGALPASHAEAAA
jgi:putative PEP-CTERM system histidine kinase